MNSRLTHGMRAAFTLAAIVSMPCAQASLGAQQLVNCPPPNGQQIDRAAAAGNQNCDRNCAAACQHGRKCAPVCANPPKNGGQKQPNPGGQNPPNPGRNPPNPGRNPPNPGRNPPNPGGRNPPNQGGQNQGQPIDTVPTIIGLATAIGTAIAVDQMTGKDWATTEELDKNGPRFPIQQGLGRFEAQGFALPGWPFAIDLETEPGTVTWLEVRYKGPDERPRTVDLSKPDGGRRVQLVNLPAEPRSLGVARYSIRSEFVEQGQKPRYRPLKIFGIGAGPNAVGALDASSENRSRPADGVFAARSPMSGRPTLLAPAISPRRTGAQFVRTALAAQGAGDFGSYLSVLAFGPKYASSPADVSWAVAAKRRFPRSQLEVLLVPGSEKGKYVSVTRVDIDLLARSQASGSWGALPIRAGVGSGTYELQARAWRTKADGGDWTGAFAPDYVYLR